MLRNSPAMLVVFAALGAVAISTLACSGGTTSETTSQPPAAITVPASGLKISAAISAASLGESSANVQLAFLAGPAATSASVEIVSVTLIDSATGNVVQSLTASTPQIWNGNGYVSWDQHVTPGGDLKASYHLSTPSWSTLDESGSGTGARGGSYTRAFKLRVNLRIDGIDVLMQSTDLHREAQFQT